MQRCLVAGDDETGITVRLMNLCPPGKWAGLLLGLVDETVAAVASFISFCTSFFLLDPKTMKIDGFLYP